GQGLADAELGRVVDDVGGGDGGRHGGVEVGEARDDGAGERIVGSQRVEVIVGELADGDDRVTIGLGGGERRQQVGGAVLPGPEVVGGQSMQCVAQGRAVHGCSWGNS